MPTYKLITRIDNATGLLGLVVKGLQEIQYPMVAIEGRQIAHDIIEHQNGIQAIGSIGDELIATGACWYVRGQHDDIMRPPGIHSAYTHIASDIANMGELYIHGVPLRVPVPHTKKHNFDEDFRDCINQASPILREMIERKHVKTAREYLDCCLHYMRRGACMARKRFRKYGGAYGANNMFWNIARAVDDIVNDIDYVGQEFKLTYSRYDANIVAITDDAY